VRWTAVSASADFSRIWLAGTQGVFLSTDFGASWTEMSAHFVGLGSATLTSLSSSASGQRLVATDTSNAFFSSDDYGGSWFNDPTNPTPAISAVVSADGTQLAMVQADNNENGPGYVVTTPSNGTLVAHTGARVELTYIGNDTFFLSDAFGTIDPP
jgi:hypothetical protein